MFGLHYLLSPIVLCDSETYAQVYNIFTRLIENLQGVMVALLYCFFNKEVILKKYIFYWKKYFLFYFLKVQLLIKKSWRTKKILEFLALGDVHQTLPASTTESSHFETLTGNGQLKRDTNKQDYISKM